MRVSRLIAVVAGVLVAAAGAAEVKAAAGNGPAASTVAAPVKGAITIAMSDLGCNALSTDTFEARTWSWGAKQVLSETQQTGKSVLDGLVLTRATDACSPALLKSVLTGLHNKELRLSQYDSNGALKATVWMMDVVTTDWQIAGSNAAGEAAEQVTLSAARFTYTDVASGSSFCYDIQAQKRC